MSQNPRSGARKNLANQQRNIWKPRTEPPGTLIAVTQGQKDST